VTEPEAALDAWLAPFLDVMGRVTRRRWAPLYLHACSARTAAGACSRSRDG
jgi:hypothetical protein